MKVAVFADIHSNYHAFNACFEDAKKQDVEAFIFLGDYVTDLAYPQKTMDLVYKINESYPCYLVRGNREAYMLNCLEGKANFQKGSKSGSLLYSYENLRQKDFDFFKILPIYQKIEIDGVKIEIAHATKSSDRYYFLENDDLIDDVFNQMESHYLLTAHSHEQYIKTKDSKMIINPGSMGVPLHSNGLTQYAILTIINQEITCELIQISYDIKKSIEDQFKSGLVNYAKYWAISILYNLLTGDNVTIDLLNKVNSLAEEKNSSTKDESLWKQAFDEMGFSENKNEIIKNWS